MTKTLTHAGGQIVEVDIATPEELRRELPYGAVVTADKIHAANFGCRVMAEFDGLDTNGTFLPYVPQPAEFCTRSRTYVAIPNSAAPLNYGFPGALVVAGAGTTITARVPTPTSLFAGSTRIALSTAATAGQMAAWRGMLPYFYQGSDLSFGGGWFLAARFGFSAISATARVFAGMSAQATITNVEINTLVNTFGFGCLSADANYGIYSCGGTANADKLLDTGIPKATALNQWIDVILSAAAGGGKLGYAFRRGGYGALWTAGTVATPSKMPAVNTMLSPSVWSSNGTTAAIQTLELAHVYAETDY